MRCRYTPILVPCLLLLTLIASPTMAEPLSLSDLRWKHRLIIAFSAAGTTQAEALNQWVDVNACRLRDRDVVVINLNDTDYQEETDDHNQPIVLDAASVQALKRGRRHANDSFEIMLIGKDGGIKANSDRPDRLDDFIALIDNMPMRKQEAAQGKSDC